VFKNLSPLVLLLSLASHSDRLMGGPMQTDYTTLVAEAVADVEAGNRHPCNTTQRCKEASGCPRSLSGLVKVDIGVETIVVFRSGTVRITTAGHDGHPCTVAFRNVEVAIYE
jgi:hypothetical protein